MARWRILLIEDDATDRQAVRRLLADAAAWEVIEAEDPKTARRLLSEQAFSAVILDLGLGSRRGAELVREVRALSRAPIVVLTGAPIDVMPDVVGAGAGRFIRKGPPEDFALRLEVVCRCSEAEQRGQAGILIGLAEVHATLPPALDAIGEDVRAVAAEVRALAAALDRPPWWGPPIAWLSERLSATTIGLIVAVLLALALMLAGARLGVGVKIPGIEVTPGSE